MNGLDCKTLLRTINTNEVPEFTEFLRLARQYVRTDPCRALFKVPVEDADRFGHLLRRFLDRDFHFHRRAGGGPRYDSMRQTCLVKDAKYFNYYID